MTSSDALPVAVIGAGPVGLAAAAHLIQRGLPVKVYEAGATVAANVRDWGHVRLFSPWEYNTDAAARALLQSHGWQQPPGKAMPTGSDLYEAYLKPLAATPEMAAVIETNATVKAITRWGADKVLSKGRETKPFVLAVSDGNGTIRRDLARAVIDASGTWTAPNPLGAGGILAEGEAENADRIAYGIPDVLGRDRAAYEGRTTLVVGAGHSAANVLIDLTRLAEQDPTTSIVWATRGENLMRVYGGGRADQLPARGELGSSLKALVDSGRVTLVSGFSATRVKAAGDQVMVEGETAQGIRELGPVDRIVVSTGQRPDLNLTRELRLDLDPWLESSKALGPLIDPNLHSCGSVPPHGHRELAHPEPGFYTVGIKSYGRAPTFLMLTGYEQVRSVVAAIAGDLAAADDIHLVLPDTGVCSTNSLQDSAAASSSCCGGPAPTQVGACCVADAEAKAEGRSGCGCGPTQALDKVAEPAGCC
ncbi:NAD(P)-binding domain-containing protein [Microvirga arsenatis]|uniref:NAD(P)-binding domain-containing protein n=1 Tax=Microvirga arsenatis TaxID=2692265 RepID=A0ABW9Z652_9HYPH|nr:NAD(P)-binding domain-containing protein [Microvirga arsenatis]NBJ12829.1 NAD(P)-binding domain-containing protein [Microvirga arsenatis]NBJ26688.1 NAD(P)-binding domain-containing protein [Microvirga arsenatis]